MFIRSLQTAVVVLGLMGASALSAHDGDDHKGKATEGQIVSIAADNFVMKTAKGNVTVTLSKDTKYEMNKQAVDKGHFKTGDKVSVIGTALTGGKLVAKEVMMGNAPSHDADHAKH